MFGNTANYTLVAPTPPSGTTPAGIWDTKFDLVAGGTNTVPHNKGQYPIEVTFFKSDGVTQISFADWDNIDTDNIGVNVSDPYTGAIIKFIF